MGILFFVIARQDVFLVLRFCEKEKSYLTNHCTIKINLRIRCITLTGP